MRNGNVLVLIPWILFTVLAVGLLSFSLFYPKIHYGGDIVEYFGMTESVMRHGSVDLTPEDQFAIEERLGHGYFTNPEYYLTDLSGKRFAVHFPFYSLLNVPVRFFLNVVGLDAYLTFRVTNALILLGISAFILKKFLRDPWKQLVFLALIFTSPLVWFLVWPGPEVFSVTLILLALFFYFHGHPWRGIAVASVASFQSQPLIIIPLTLLGVTFWRLGKRRELSVKNIGAGALQLLFMFVPNIYYAVVFGTYASHGKLLGVGFQNASLLKFWELLFDPNIGLFYYAPLICIFGLATLALYLRKHGIGSLWLPIMFGLVSLLYLTNTNWNSGTAGYGPTRYALPLIPLFIFLILTGVKRSFVWILAISWLVVMQLPILRMNGYLSPTFENDKALTPMARFFLDNFPTWYAPTDEIFIERAGNREGGWETAVYKSADGCKKVYVYKGNIEPAVRRCGFVPQPALTRVLSDPMSSFYITY